jgi:hypothetical protein
MPDESDSQQGAEQEGAATAPPTAKPRLPLIDDEYPMLIDRDEQG